MKEITVPAHTNEIENVTTFIDTILEDMNCPMKAQMQIDVAIDEILSNIVHYAYEDSSVSAELRNINIHVEDLEGGVGISISFRDEGFPYNPLEREDPDITLSAEDRQIGGLGIFIVKKTMDEVTYSREGGCNVLTITKNF